MASVSVVRDGLAVRLRTISGLRVYDTVPGQVEPPCAVVEVDSIHFDQTMGRGSDELLFILSLAVSAQVDRVAQDALDGYLDGSGAMSVKAAIGGDATLGGIVSFARVPGVRNYGSVKIGAVTMWGADFVVEVMT